MTQSENVRLFLGIRLLPNPKILAVHKHLQALLHDCKIKWVEPINYHVTIMFLGNIDSSILNLIEEVLEGVGRNNKAFDLHFDSPGYFLTKTRPDAIWYGFKPSTSFSKLRTEIQLGLKEIDLASTNQDPILHLTLGRVKECSSKNLLDESLSAIDNITGCIEVRSIQLVQSILSPKGPTYLTLKEISLANL